MTPQVPEMAGPITRPKMPMKNVFDLPRELRDMIYMHLFKGVYTDILPPYLDVHLSSRVSLPRSPRLEILVVSKQISAEALSVLYQSSTFNFYSTVGNDIAWPFDFCTYNMIREKSLLLTKTALRLQNVRLHINMLELPFPGTHSDQVAQNLDILSKIGDRRNMCEITLKFDIAPFLDVIGTRHWVSSLLMSISRLSIFATVRIKVLILFRAYHSVPFHASYPGKYPSIEAAIEAFMDMITEFVWRLEFSLGPAEHVMEKYTSSHLYKPQAWKADKSRSV